MLQDTDKQEVNAYPGLGNIPILGALFRSRDFIHEPDRTGDPGHAVPCEAGRPGHCQADRRHGRAGDAEAIFLGHMEKMYGVGTDGMRGSYSGSVGFVLD